MLCGDQIRRSQKALEHYHVSGTKLPSGQNGTTFRGYLAVRGNDLGIDARRKLIPVQVEEISRWREREEELALGIARAEAVRLAKHVLDLGEQLKSNEQKLDELVKVSEAAPLLEEKGFQAVTAAKCLVAWSHEGRVRSEAAFACLAGVNPTHPRIVG